MMFEPGVKKASFSDDDNTSEVDNYAPPPTSFPFPEVEAELAGRDEAVQRRRTNRLSLGGVPDDNDGGGEESERDGRRRRRVSIDQPFSRSFGQQRPPTLCPSNDHTSRIYKVIVVGEIHSGKSSLVKRYVHNFFSESYSATVGLDFMLKLIRYNEDLTVRLQLWDIAGQERFSSMTRAYYRGTTGAVIVFDLTNAYTFQVAIDKWKSDVDRKCSLPGNRPVPVLLVANKSDLKRDPRLPDDVEISKLVLEKGFVPKWFKTSAKTGENVNDAMSIMMKYIMAMDDWSPCTSPPEDNHFGPSHGTCLPPQNVIETADVFSLPDASSSPNLHGYKDPAAAATTKRMCSC